MTGGDLLSFAGVIVAVVVAVPAAVLFVEVVASFFGKPDDASLAAEGAQPFTVIVPAHNEQAGIADTVSVLKSGMRACDRILAVADNCTDRTAEMARANGAEVIVRTDPARRGKGYAINFAIRHLQQSPPSVVIVFDADCRVRMGSLAALAYQAEVSGRPAQSLDLMVASPGNEARQALAVMAWRLKNHARPLGLKAMNGPCHLAGTGMAIPWSALIKANVDSDELAEDLKLGVDLALMGHPAAFLPSVMIESEFPVSNAGRDSQQKRWELGSWRVAGRSALTLLGAALRRRDWGLLLLALDLAVPPVTSYIFLYGLFFVLTAGLALLGVTAPLVVASAGLVLLAAALGLAVPAYGKDLHRHLNPLAIAAHVVSKARVYWEISRAKTAGWERAERADKAETSTDAQSRTSTGGPTDRG